jgi:ATP-dependent helicase/DNAse subunit B
MDHVLKLEPQGELALETDYARRGSLVHRVLAEFHRQMGEGDDRHLTVSAHDQSVARALFNDVLGEAIAGSSRDGVDAALVELDRRQIEKWADGYFEQHRKYDDAWTKLDMPLVPAHFEVRFGPPRPGETDHDPRSIDEPYLLDIGNEQILVVGRIDRIDIGRAGGRTVFNVIDYKSGQRPSLNAELIATGQRLQLPIYVMAAQHLILSADDAATLSAGYWSMDKGFDPKRALKVHQFTGESVVLSDDWPATESALKAVVGEFVTGIRRGDFPVFSNDEHCTSRCHFSTVCRVAQVRSLGKTWNDDPVEDKAADARPSTIERPSPART